MKKIRSKLTYANVIATLCLCLLVGGGTAYATSAIPPGSVGTEQLANLAVTSPKLATGSVITSKIGNYTVTNAKLSHGSITENRLAPGSVGSGEIQTGAVTNSKIATGAVNSTSVADNSLTTADLATKPVVVTGGSVSTTNLTTECTHYDRAELTIYAPSSGTVTVNATSWMFTTHEEGIEDSIRLNIGESSTECFGGDNTTAYSIPSTLPGFPEGQDVTMPVMRSFDVAGGLHTYYLNGIKTGLDTEQFYFAGMTATFIPN